MHNLKVSWEHYPQLNGKIEVMFQTFQTTNQTVDILHIYRWMYIYIYMYIYTYIHIYTQLYHHSHRGQRDTVWAVRLQLDPAWMRMPRCRIMLKRLRIKYTRPMPWARGTTSGFDLEILENQLDLTLWHHHRHHHLHYLHHLLLHGRSYLVSADTT